MRPRRGTLVHFRIVQVADIAALTRLIEPEAKALGFDLVRVQMIGGSSDPTLQVMAERPDTRQLTIDDCANLSRRLSDVFDEADPIPEAYRLEVSSPGIDRPLTRLKDFSDWAGHEARVTLSEPRDGRKQFTGTVIGVEDDVVIMLPKDGSEARLPFSGIHAAKLTLTNKLIAATAPLSSAGADELEAEDDTIQVEG
jgi:ribosome maturation factor RimP